MALRSGQGEVRVHDSAGDAARLVQLHELRGSATRLVLIGCGHSHALVLRHWADARPNGVDITLVTDRAETLYSGMLPGLLAGRYSREELVIEAIRLADGAGATLVLGRATGIDPASRTLTLEDGRSLPYDVLALDVGATLAGLDDLDDVLPARPPDRLLARFESGEPIRSVVVVGGGAAGVELAAAARVRVPGAQVSLIEAGSRILPGYHERVADRAASALKRRAIHVRTGTPFSEPTGSPADVTVWATGAAARPFLVRSGLPADDSGFVLVDGDLRVPGHPEIFASGDCAARVGSHVPRAGVHAVRQAPILAHNLAAVVEGAPTRTYHPQKDFLTLLNLGDGTALATKWGRVLEGGWVQTLKDRIDRRFIRSLNNADS